MLMLQLDSIVLLQNFIKMACTIIQNLKDQKVPEKLQKNRLIILNNLLNKYPIDSVEDGMAEGDWDGWKMLTDRIGKKCQIVGDDLFVTNVEYLKKGIEMGCANSILIKVNQIGITYRNSQCN